MEKLFITTLCRCAEFIDKKGTFRLFDSIKINTLAPNSIFTECYNLLKTKGVIRISHLTPSSCFYIEQNCIYINTNSDCIYRLFLKELSDECSFYDNLYYIINCEYTTHDLEEVLKVWKRISYEECLEHLKFQIMPLDNYFKTSENTKDTIERLLDKVTPAKICCLLWSTCTSAIGDYQRGKISKSFARNRAISNITYRAAEILSGQKDYKPSRREESLPQSAFSFIFFKVFLKMEDDGFNTVPSYEYLEQFVRELQD